MTSVSNIPDPQLLVKIQAGDGDSFRQLFDRYWDLLWRLAARKTGDTGSAEDMVQDLFIELWNRRQTIVLTTSLRTYLVSCLYLKIFKHFRKKGFHQKHHDDFFRFIQAHSKTTPVDAKEFETEYGNLQEVIAQTVALMPQQMKTIFSLKHYKGYTTAQIAGRIEYLPRNRQDTSETCYGTSSQIETEYPAGAMLLPLFLQMIDSSY